MKVKVLVLAVVFALIAWSIVPVFAYRDGESVAKWISLIPSTQREQFVYARLSDSGEPDYVKVALLEAIALDLSRGRGQFHIKDYEPMLMLTKWKNEPLGEPVGILAGTVLLATKDCGVIKRFLSRYSDDSITRGWIEKNAVRSHLQHCL